MDMAIGTSAGTRWARGSALAALGGGRFAVTISADWNTGSKPNGGYTMALAVRAVIAHAVEQGCAADRLDLLSGTCHFLRACDPGPAEIQVEAVRTGRTVRSFAAVLVQDGRQRSRVLAALGSVTGDVGYRSVDPPELPSPAECLPAVPVLANGLRLPITDAVEFRFPAPCVMTGAGPRDAPGPVESAAWMRFRDGDTPDTGALLLAVDAFTPALLELGLRGWSPTLELTVHQRGRPVAGWLRVVRRTRLLADGHFEEDAEVWDDVGALVADSRQLARLNDRP